MLLQGYPTVRARLYQVYVAVGLAFAAFAAYLGATGHDLPEWYLGGTAALSVLGTGLGFVAASNVSPDASAGPAVDPAEQGELENDVAD